MTIARSDDERVLKLIERVRLLIAIDDELPSETKLNTQPVLKMLEALVLEGNEADRGRAAEYYRYLYGELQDSPDVEALLAAMRVFAPYL
jgi:hypothetical protein